MKYIKQNYYMILIINIFFYIIIQMNNEKLSKLQTTVRIGGKGTPRRKMKKTHKTNIPGGDDKKLQAVLKKMGTQNISEIEEVNMFKDDGNIIHFDNPKGKYLK